MKFCQQLHASVEKYFQYCSWLAPDEKFCQQLSASVGQYCLVFAASGYCHQLSAAVGKYYQQLLAVLSTAVGSSRAILPTAIAAFGYTHFSWEIPSSADRYGHIRMVQSSLADRELRWETLSSAGGGGDDRAAWETLSSVEGATELHEKHCHQPETVNCGN